ncbi:MAG: energy-coupling factor transporter transmembrane component T [Collinsella sp.]|nr:energy-coupling factor transporter transmembrane component T [Collinsella sp.]
MVDAMDYVDGDTILHRLNPVAKLALAASIILSLFLARSFTLLVLLIALTFALAAFAGVGRRLRSLALMLLPLAALVLLLQVAFVREGETLVLFVTTQGLITGVKACLRLLGVALPLALMLSITKLNDLANACVQVLHIPYRYAFAFTTALRFVPLLGQEMDAVMEAQTARGVRFDTKNPLTKMKLMLPLCIPLLVSAAAKADAAALAAEQRGFHLRTPDSSYRKHPLLAMDVGAMLAALALVMASALTWLL